MNVISDTNVYAVLLIERADGTLIVPVQDVLPNEMCFIRQTWDEAADLVEKWQAIDEMDEVADVLDDPRTSH